MWTTNLMPNDSTKTFPKRGDAIPIFTDNNPTCRENTINPQHDNLTRHRNAAYTDGLRDLATMGHVDKSIRPVILDSADLIDAITEQADVHERLLTKRRRRTPVIVGTLLTILAASLVSGCGGRGYDQPRDLITQKEMADFEAEIGNEIDHATLNGAIAVSQEYPTPNFGDSRWFNTKDQFGCTWWFRDTGRFTSKMIDILPNGKPNCPNQNDAPKELMQTVVRNHAGDIIDMTEYARLSKVERMKLLYHAEK